MTMTSSRWRKAAALINHCMKTHDFVHSRNVLNDCFAITEGQLKMLETTTESQRFETIPEVINFGVQHDIIDVIHQKLISLLYSVREVSKSPSSPPPKYEDSIELATKPKKRKSETYFLPLTERPEAKRPKPKLRLYKKPSENSNKLLIKRGIEDCLLNNGADRHQRYEVLAAMNASTSLHFMVLFREIGGRNQFRALYEFNLKSCEMEVNKIFGVGPKLVKNNMIEAVFKYNSGIKSFTKVEELKCFTVTVDGFCIRESFWQNRKGKLTTTLTLAQKTIGFK